jgi:hypothetical protein
MANTSFVKWIFQPVPPRFRERFSKLVVAVFALGTGGILIYLGSRGLLDHAGPYRATCAERWVCPLSVGGGVWALTMSVRLFRGSVSRGGHLLAGPELLVASLLTIAGSVWLLTEGYGSFDLRIALAGVVGVAGAWRWWSAYRTARQFPQKPAA